MTGDLSINGNKPQGPWKFGTYEKTQVGAFITPSKICSLKEPFTALPYANEALGVKVVRELHSKNYENYYDLFASAEIGAGTSATAKFETGCVFTTPDDEGYYDWDVTVSADARIAKSLIGKDVEINSNMNNVIDAPEIDIHDESSVNYNLVTHYNAGSMAAGVNVMANWYPTDKLTFGTGVRAAIVSANAANVELNSSMVTDINFPTNGDINGLHSVDVQATVGERHTQLVVSPVAEIKAKPGNWEIGGKFSFDEAKISAAYKF